MTRVAINPLPLLAWYSLTGQQKRPERRKVLLRSLRFLAITIALGATVDSILLAFAYYFPFNALFPLPSQILALLDFRLMVSLVVVEVPMGIGIGLFLSKALGERKQNIIEEAKAMREHRNLRVTERDKIVYVVSLKAKKGCPIPFFLEKLAGTGIIQQASDSDLQGVEWSTAELTDEELGLSTSSI